MLYTLLPKSNRNLLPKSNRPPKKAIGVRKKAVHLLLKALFSLLSLKKTLDKLQKEFYDESVMSVLAAHPFISAFVAASAAASAATVATAGRTPKLPETPPPVKLPEITQEKPKRRGLRRETILTSPLGVTEEAPITKPTLLGGGF